MKKCKKNEYKVKYLDNNTIVVYDRNGNVGHSGPGVLCIDDLTDTQIKSIVEDAIFDLEWDRDERSSGLKTLHLEREQRFYKLANPRK